MKHLETFNGYSIYQTNSRDNPHFWCEMGRFFADKQIRKELGGPLDDSADHIWLVVKDQTGEIVAFSSCRFNQDRSVAWFNETCVFPLHRRRGLFTRLFELKYRLCVAEGARVVKGLANALSRPMFEKHGWRVASVRGSWTYYEKVVEVADGSAIVV